MTLWFENHWLTTMRWRSQDFFGVIFKEGVRGLREMEMLEWICYVRHEGHFEYGPSEDPVGTPSLKQ